MQELLNKVSEIAQANRMAMETMRSKGELFNIFDILNVQHYEVSTHSAFLCEMLNPKGSHGMGDVFLNLLVNIIPQLKELGLKTKNAKVFTEFSDQVNGRIDLLITSGTKAIVIENKIYACDQENQLKRYSTFLQSFSDSRLLYLTLEGHHATDYSAGGMIEGEDYLAISYCSEILSWLRKCYSAAKGKTNLQCSIKQYSNLIKELTNQMMDEESNNQMMDLLCCKENICKTAEILNLYDEIRDRMLDEHVFSKLDHWFKTRQLEKSDECDFCIRPKGWKHHWIRMNVGSVNYDIGIWKESGRLEKEIKLSTFAVAGNRVWPFGWINVNDVIYDNVSIASGETLKYLKRLISSIIEEVEEREDELIANKIIL